MDSSPQGVYSSPEASWNGLDLLRHVWRPRRRKGWLRAEEALDMVPMDEPEPFAEDAPARGGGASGWKGMAGIVVLAAVGYLAADWMGWLPRGERPRGERPEVPYTIMPLDSGLPPRPEPAPRERDARPPSPAPRGENPAADTVRSVEATEPPREVESPTVEEGPLGLDQFVLLEPGTFEMGFRDAAADQQPVRAVILSRGFYLQRTEVTQGQWRSVMGSNPSHFSACGDDCPVEQVSWHDVQAFLRALNQKFPGRNYRLPTEAEWEYAARAGRKGTLEDAGSLEELAWFDGNAGARTHPVQRKVPNAWGLYDMLGNVAEWVSDWYRADYYRTGPAVDPPGPRDGAARVVRGGSWGSPRRFVETLGRTDRDPFTRDFTIGFRLARDP